jgi:hypothetical protein
MNATRDLHKGGGASESMKQGRQVYVVTLLKRGARSYYATLSNCLKAGLLPIIEKHVPLA